VTAVLVTRPGGEADPVVGALEAVGYRVHAVPTVATQPLDFDRPDLARYDWVVVTSAAGVDALAELPAGPRWAAVGSATARALRARGVEPDLVPNEANGLALANALPDVHGKRVLLVRASAAAADLPTRLRERGAAVDLAAIVFASGSAIRGFTALGGTTAWPAITIGPGTTTVAQQCGFHVIAQAEMQSTEALVAAVVRAIPVEERKSA
jgi:uroporphyrinogen-III synthase